jgi:hypothetical protein
VTRYWIGVASGDHVEKGIDGGFAQLGHGKLAPIRRLSPGDWIAYYSPQTALKGGEPMRAFTAIGRVEPGDVCQVEQAPGFRPHRRNVAFRKSARPADIAPLLETLSFTRGEGRRWGMAFRRSVLEVSGEDFAKIAHAMGVKIPT